MGCEGGEEAGALLYLELVLSVDGNGDIAAWREELFSNEQYDHEDEHDDQEDCYAVNDELYIHLSVPFFWGLDFKT